jgi:hypothetical protein
MNYLTYALVSIISSLDAIKRKGHAIASHLNININSSEDPNLLIHVGVRKDELVDIPAGKPGKFRLLG